MLCQSPYPVKQQKPLVHRPVYPTRLHTLFIFSLFLVTASCLLLSFPTSLLSVLTRLWPSRVEDRYSHLLQNFPIADTQVAGIISFYPSHNDLPGKIRWIFGKLGTLDIEHLDARFDTDMARLRQGGVGIQFWSAFVPCSVNVTNYNDHLQQTLAQIDLIKLMVQSQPQTLEMAFTCSDMQSIYKKNKIASYIGVEGGHSIDNSLSVLRLYYSLGVRYMTLTHVCHTAWADSAGPKEPMHQGLTEFGVKIIKEMNRLGMMIDLSHTSWTVMRQVLNLTEAPVLFSHSAAASICSTQRNVPDDVLVKLQETDGVVMINFWPALIACQSNATVAQVADHIDHIVKVAGVDKVGFGGDFDGIDTFTTGLEDVSKYPVLLQELLHRGYSDEALQGFMYANLERVFFKVEKVRDLYNGFPDETLFTMNRTCPE